jgi:electron-transferring-flavoprotein dehydrogenase
MESIVGNQHHITSSSEYAAPIKREEMEVDIAIIGGGVAGLSAALQISKQIEAHNKSIADGKIQGAPINDPMIVVIEKASEIGAHSLSGAVLNPVALKELIPDYEEQGCPIEANVTYDAVHYLGESFSFKLPITPPPFHNIGNKIISIAKFNRWLGGLCEARGINILPGFAAVEALYEGDKIVGIRTGDKGLSKSGEQKANFEPGIILRPKVTIFAEGTRGSLFKQVSKKLNLRQDRNHEVFEEGVKEIVQMPKGTVTPGRVVHTMGFPLSKSVGGTFVYTLPDDKIVVGLVAYLDSKDPLLDPHRELQKLKTHPFFRKMLQGGKVISYGGKTLPAGGWFSIPKLYGDSWMVTGDSASLVDVQRLKGIHLAMKSGMLAGETAVQALIDGDTTEAGLKKYEQKLHSSYIKEELYKVRNFHQALSLGIPAGLPLIAIQELTGGKGLQDNMPSHVDSKTTEKVVDFWGADPFSRPENQLPKPDGELFFDKLSSVYLTGTMHDEDSPNHLLLKDGDICREICEPQYKSPCNHFCPAAVYEMVPSTQYAGKKELQINFTNCIHCKTCDIKCPFENIDWTVPEGGGGPKYKDT